MITEYDPYQAPDPKAWLKTDEMTRIELVRKYHRRMRIKIPGERLHMVVHTIVENQAALGDETPVQETLLRLMNEGLDRHEAIHAIGGVLLQHFLELTQNENAADDEKLSESYFEALRRLKASDYQDPQKKTRKKRKNE